MLTIGAITNVNASEKKSAPATTNIPTEIKIMLNRLEEIKSIKKSELERSERKALRKEVHAIKSQIRSTGNGIYIGSGALIIILLLIILL